MWERIIQVIEVATHVVELVGICVIFWGVAVGLVEFVSAQASRNRGTNLLYAIAQVRGKVGVYLLLGLEFLIASDIAQTIVEPSYERVILLGAIVIIRTILSFYLSRELEAIGVQPKLQGAKQHSK